MTDEQPTNQNDLPSSSPSKPPRSNVKILIALIIVVGAIGFYTAHHNGHAYKADTAEQEALKQSIAQEMAKLVVPPAGMASTKIKAHEAYAAIKGGDFAKARSMIDDVNARSKLNWYYHPFDTLMDTMVPAQDEAFVERLDQWMKADPNAALPYLLRAKYDLKTAWAVRGHNFNSVTQAGHLESFEELAKLALVNIAEFMKRDAGKNPYALELELEILRGFGNTRTMEAAFEKAIAVAPEYLRLYSLRFETLQPKWGGSVEAMKQFTAYYADKAPANSPLKMLYLQLYDGMLDTASIACYKHGDDVTVAMVKDCVAAWLKANGADAIEQKTDEAFKLYSSADHVAFAYRVNTIMEKLLQNPQLEPEAMNLLQRLAMATNSDTQLVETNPGHNYYLVDELTALHWDWEGNNKNAQTKYLEAVEDIKRDNPQMGEDDYMALADLYDDLSLTFDHLSQFKQSIAYESVADAIDGRGTADNCRTYYKLQLYAESIAECTKAIERHMTDPVHLLYWRGFSYKESGDADHALADFTAAADSENYDMAGRAASNAEVMLGERRDIAGQLAFMEKRPYLFDEKRMNHEALAVQFNNRCYAKMQLKDLQGALDDCNASLKYGSVPDAIAKKAQLEKMLQK